MVERNAWDGRDWKRWGRGDGRRPLVLSAAVTPFAGREVDLAGFEENLRFQDAMGIDGVLVAGTTGEAASLSREERDALVRTAASALAGDVLIVAGVRPAKDAEGAAEDAARLRELGADIGLVAPPRGGPDDGDAAPFFDVLTSRSPLPVLAYHPPSFAERPLPDGVIRAVRDLPGLAGVKDSLGEERTVRLWAEREEPGFGVFVGSAPLFERMAGEVTGGILAVASVHPEEYAAYARTVGAGAPDGSVLTAARATLDRFTAGGVAALKEVCEEHALFGGAPLTRGAGEAPR